MERAQNVGLISIILNNKKNVDSFFLFANYNDGHRKNFFCVAVNLLELSELQEVMMQIQQNDEMSVKEQCLYVLEMFQKMLIEEI